MGCQKSFPRLAHFSIRFHREDTVAMVKKHAGEESGSGGDVGDDGIGLESARGLHKFDDLWRISRAIAGGVFDAGRGALCGSFDGHRLLTRSDTSAAAGGQWIVAR